MSLLGSCLVVMEDGSEKRVDEIQKGDRVKGGYQVLCVVKKSVGVKKMVKFPLGLVLTPWHPVREDSHMDWKYPCLWLNKVDKVYTKHLYDFVLDKGYILTVNYLQVVTLGHGFEGNIVGHNYYGTEKVIEELKKDAGWERGIIYLTKF
jgi:hypothetical protein